MNVAQAFLPVLVSVAQAFLPVLVSIQIVAQAFLPVLVSIQILSAAQKRPVDYSDLAPEAQQILARQGIHAAEFPALIRSIDEQTATRLREGERDHLIYFILQSAKFTHLPRIEPALSAREFVEKLKEAPIPRNARDRMQDFVRALARPQTDERMNWFRKSLPPEERTLAQLSAEYSRAMRFLYRKEFGPAQTGNSLYQQRGHSSDTRIESSFAVWSALAVSKNLDAAFQANRVLIAGPGEDFAPRTAFVESYAPQSYQPFAVADALLSLGLAQRDRLRIDCVDINDRVLDFFRSFPLRRERRLVLFEDWDDPEYVEYFRALGHNIGAETKIPAGKSLLLAKDAAERVSAARLNVITERYDPSPQYDLIVATNILVYFNNTELLLALSNLHSMLRDGGVLIHNELRPEVEEYTRALGFPPLQARTLRLSRGTKQPLFDSFVIHRKARGLR